MIRNLSCLMAKETDVVSLMDGEITVPKGRLNVIPIESSEHDYDTYMFSHFFPFLLAFDYLKQRENEKVLIVSDISGSEVHETLDSLIHFRNNNIKELKVEPPLIKENPEIVTADIVERIDVLTQTPHLFTLGAGCTKLCTQMVKELDDEYGLIIFSSLVSTLAPIPFTDGSILLRALLTLRNLADETDTSVIAIHNTNTESLWEYTVASTLEHKKEEVVSKILWKIVGRFSFPYPRAISNERLYIYAMNFAFDKQLKDEIIRRIKRNKMIPDGAF